MGLDLSFSIISSTIKPEGELSELMDDEGSALGGLL